MLSRIDAAKEYATKMHYGQFRKLSGKPYITHPEWVANKVAELGGTENEIIIAWLHDLPKDTSATYHDIYSGFGGAVAIGVDWLTNASASPCYQSLPRSVRKQINLEKIVRAPVYIKRINMVDRLHNLLSIEEGKEFANKGWIYKYISESWDLFNNLGYDWYNGESPNYDVSWLKVRNDIETCLMRLEEFIEVKVY